MSRRTKGKLGDYDVGYAKPPKGSEFQKGQSGNPKGRPKGKLSTDTIAKNVLYERIRIQQNGKVIAIPALQAILLQIRNNALKGDYRSAMAAFQIANRLSSANENSQASDVLNPLDDRAMYEILQDFIEHNPPQDVGANRSSSNEVEHDGNDDQEPAR